MKILMLYAKDEYTTGVHIENYLKRSKHQVMTAGLTAPGLANVDNSRIHTPAEFVITDLLKKLPAQPEIIITVQGFYNLIIHGIDMLTIPTVYYGIDTHTRTKESIVSEAMKYSKVCFAQKKGCREFKERFDKKAVFMPCCAEPLIHKEFDVANEYDFAFVGGVDLEDAHKERREALKKLSKEYKVWIGNAYGYFMSNIYSKAKVVFNYSMNDDINMRIFEGMSCKRAVLTNKLSSESGLNELFEADKQIVCFDEKNMLEQAKKLINDDKYRESIANEGYKAVLSKHTYEIRTEEILCQK